MRANASLRAFSGFMIFFLAFLLRTVHFPGVTDKAALAGMIAAAGVGGFLGSALGSALKTRRPLLITFGILGLSTVVTALCAAYFGLWAALVVALVAAFGQVLSKLALDSTVQQEVGEEIRTSAFAVSETLNQLSWVAGGLAGLLMGFDGIAVESYSRNNTSWNVETVGAEYSAVLGQIKQASAMLDLGTTQEVAVRADTMTTVIRLINDEYFVAMALEPSGNLGRARYMLRLKADSLLEQLS